MSPALEAEVKSEDSGVVLKPHQDVVKAESNSEVSGLVLKPKQEIVAKSAAQIIHEQRGK